MKVEQRLDNQFAVGNHKIRESVEFYQLPLLVQEIILSSSVVTDRSCALVCKSWNVVSFKALIKFFLEEAQELTSSLIKFLPQNVTESQIRANFEKIKNEVIEAKVESLYYVTQVDMRLIAKIA
jgi:hypothetical protein